MELRKVFSFFESKSLLKREKDIKDQINHDNRLARQAQEQSAWEMQAAKTLEKISKKKDLGAVKTIRNVERSKKNEVKIKKD